MLTFPMVLPEESVNLKFAAGALSSGGTIVPIRVVAVMLSSSDVLYGAGSVLSSYSAVTVSPSATRSL